MPTPFRKIPRTISMKYRSAKNAERYLVCDGLADQRGTGIEQRLHSPGMLRWHRIGARPVVIATAGGHASNVEQILGSEAESAERATRGAVDADACPRDEGVDAIAHAISSTLGEWRVHTTTRPRIIEGHFTLKCRACGHSPVTPTRIT